MTYNPPHKATDRNKLAALVRAFRRGDEVQPIVYNGESAITGSHRIAAARIARVDVPAVECAELDYRRAAYVADVETHGEDFNLFCSALAAVTEDAAVRAALEDQTDGDYIDADRVVEAMGMDVGELTELRGW